MNEERELQKFIENPQYRDKVILKLRKKDDRDYQNKIKIVEKEKENIENERKNEIKRLEDERWEMFADGCFGINETEGIVKVNDSTFLFSSIQGAEMNLQTSARIVTKNTSNSKKKASIGGATVGGMIGGSIGATVGGSNLGKTKTSGTSVSNSIPTCTHMGVLIDIDGFQSEVVLIKTEVTQNSRKYSLAYDEMGRIISRLREVSKLTVPKSFIKVEDMESVKEIDRKIDDAKRRLEIAIKEKPEYKIPEMYRTKEQMYMSDEEYLEYLRNEDDTREATVKKKEQNEKTKKVVSAIKNIVLWILTVLCLLLSCLIFITTSDAGATYAVTGIFLLMYAIMACPTITEKTKEIESLRLYYKYKVSISIIIFIIWILLISK